MLLTFAQIQQFKIDGYLVLPRVLQPEQLSALKALTDLHGEQRIEPFELETELHYPGAPRDANTPGGDTIRRLQNAYARDELFQSIAKLQGITLGIRHILGSEQLWLNPNHHNCVMTKQPAFSSETLWHRDTRYWNFSDKYLINAWFALGDEQLENGAMKILPGSHRWEVQDEALDQAQFLKPEHSDNRDRIATQRLVSLNAGDALLFSAHCFHAAGKNISEHAKYSLVFTYHGESTKPLDGRSVTASEIQIL
ncbi:MAG: phytanoyl-CoA hydroxylase [Cryomorphaceae bacterium]|jgi:phytanoyl-CoA hydroxylase